MHTLYQFKENGEIVKLHHADLSKVVSHAYEPNTKFVWLDLTNPTEEELRFLEEELKIHPLEIEDALDVEDQSAKIEEFKKHLFVTFLNPIIVKDEVDAENLAFFVFKKLIVTIRDEKYSLFKKTINRIYKKSKLLKEPSTILHTFLDVIFDELLIIADKIDDYISEIETKIFAEGTEEILEQIYVLKQKILNIRKMILPQKEIVYMLSKSSKFVSKKEALYFKDIYEHINTVINQLDIYRDSTNNMLQVYISLSSQSTNEVMKILTVVTSIFLPLSLIAGIYGMNFHYIPELNWKYGYFATLGLMLFIALTLLIIYKRKGWI